MRIDLAGLFGISGVPGGSVDGDTTPSFTFMLGPALPAQGL